MDPAIILYIVIGALAIGLFFLLRSLVLWYFHIHKRVDLMEEMNAYLIFLAREKDPQKFDAYQKQWRDQYETKTFGKPKKHR